MTIPNLLARWAIAEPEVCLPKVYPTGVTWYAIEKYEFMISSFTGDLVASYGLGKVTGQPALDWLLGCVIRAIEASELEWQVELQKKAYITKLWIINGIIPQGQASNSIIIESLLTVYLDWLEAQNAS